VKAGWQILELNLDFLNANYRLIISQLVASNAGDYAGIMALTTSPVVSGQNKLFKI
jgi:PTS system N-acetylglucosamine-specific IIC component